MCSATLQKTARLSETGSTSWAMDASSGTYDYDSGEIVGLIENLPDLTKAVARIDDLGGTPVLLVGGRGGYIAVCRLVDGIPERVMDIFLPKQSTVPVGVLNQRRALTAAG